MNSQTTILISTDFRVASLHTLRLALELIDEPRVDVVLLHCQTLDDSITEMLFYSPTQIIRDLATDDFNDAVSIIRNRFEPKIGNLRIKLFHGYAQSAFDTLLETLKIDSIFIPESYRLHLSNRAFDPWPYVQKCPIPHYQIGSKGHPATAETDKLENLFLY
ncbi:hypothetical protein [Spirosoma arcticum]